MITTQTNTTRAIGDWVTYIYLPDISPPTRKQGLLLFRGRSLGPITGRATLSVAGAVPEAVPGMVAGLPRTLASLPPALSLQHSSVGSTAALVISFVMAAVAGKAGGERCGNGGGRLKAGGERYGDGGGADGLDGREGRTTRARRLTCPEPWHPCRPPSACGTRASGPRPRWCSPLTRRPARRKAGGKR